MATGTQPAGATDLRIAVAGDLDLTSSPALVDRFDAALERVPGRIVLDLRGVTFADSTGLAALIRCRRRAVRGGTALVLDVGDGAIARLLDLTCLHRVFDLV